MSVNLHEGPQPHAFAAAEIEKGASHRLDDLAKLIESPVVPLVFAKANTLIQQGKRIEVGVSTNKAVAEGATPTICIVVNPRLHGEFGNEFHPQRWEYERVDLIGQSNGYTLRVAVRGNDSGFFDERIPHKITAMEDIEQALDQALDNARIEGTLNGQDLNGFPVRGFERLESPKL